MRLIRRGSRCRAGTIYNSPTGRPHFAGGPPLTACRLGPCSELTVPAGPISASRRFRSHGSSSPAEAVGGSIWLWSCTGMASETDAGGRRRYPWRPGGSRSNRAGTGRRAWVWGMPGLGCPRPACWLRPVAGRIDQIACQANHSVFPGGGRDARRLRIIFAAASGKSVPASCWRPTSNIWSRAG